MATRVDLSACTAVAWCSCGWRGEATTRAGAQAAAEDHRRRVHPGDRQAAAAERKRRQRARAV